MFTPIHLINSGVILSPNGANLNFNNSAGSLWGMGIGFRTGKLIIDSEYKAYQPKLDLPSLSRLGFEASLGYRHFFDENLGLYAELGLAKSIFQFGFTGRF